MKDQSPLHTEIVYLAVLGKFLLPPGVQKTNLRNKEQIITYSIKGSILDKFRDIKVDTSDCTIFTITHSFRKKKRITGDYLDEILDLSLDSVSELLLWYKVRERIGKVSPYSRRVGRLDVKFFAVEGINTAKAIWLNPIYALETQGLNMIYDLLPNIVVTNGPSSAPISLFTKRLLNSLDLVNLGFYTESFLTVFSLLDDTLQNVLKAGFEKKRYPEKDMNYLMKSIKDNRLLNFLHLLKLLNWQSLEDMDIELYNELISVNGKRNNIMHGDLTLNREEALKSIEVALKTLTWLQSNPFKYEIEVLPPLIVVKPEYKIFST